MNETADLGHFSPLSDYRVRCSNLHELASSIRGHLTSMRGNINRKIMRGRKPPLFSKTFRSFYEPAFARRRVPCDAHEQMEMFS